MRYDFMRRAWWMLLIWPIIVCLLAPAVLLAPSWIRGYAFGALAASGLWGSAYLVATMSGSSPPLLGQLAEQWTAGELRRLRKRGWRLLNQVHFRPWDIDHVVLGPGGAIVVETKFSSDGWRSSSYTDKVISDACARVRTDALDLSLFLGKSILPSTMVRPLVVLWGRADLVEIDRDRDGVRILSGHLLRDWLDTIPDAGLDVKDTSLLYDKLTRHVTTRDRQDADRVSNPARPLSTLIMLICGGVVLGLAAWWTELETMHLLGWDWFILIGVAFAAAQWPFTRYRASRPWRVAWLAGSQAATALIAIAYVVTAGRRLL